MDLYCFGGWVSLAGCFLPLRPASVTAQDNISGDIEPKLWALLVAGSNEWYNYRHQADVYHAYQILHNHGIPDEQIVVMHYDDIANNEDNPRRGIVINHPKGKDVYHGVPKDYTGEDVTPENFIRVLLGDAAALNGTGSGKVINSGPNDHVFVNFVDHGAEGILAFPDGELTLKQLTQTILKLHQRRRYDKLLFYVEACEAGSMFRKVLPANINVFATTAADYNESSYACYLDEQLNTYLGDVYSVKWMEDSDKRAFSLLKEDIETETLSKQYQIVKKETNTSHVQEYGDLSIAKLVVGQFQGEEEATQIVYPKVRYDAVRSEDVPVELLRLKIRKAKSVEERAEAKKQLDLLLAKRKFVQSVVKQIVKQLADSIEQQQSLLKRRSHELHEYLDCHHDLAKAFSRHCFNLGKHPFALTMVHVLANMCLHDIEVPRAIAVMKKVCRFENDWINSASIH